MSKFSRATMGGLLFSLWLMCFVFPFALFTSFTDHTPVGEFLGQMLMDFLVLWFICGVVAHGVIGMFDDLNNRGRRNNDANDPNSPSNGNDGPDIGDKRPGDHKSDRDNSGDDQSRR